MSGRVEVRPQRVRDFRKKIKIKRKKEKGKKKKKNHSQDELRAWNIVLAFSRFCLFLLNITL